MFAHQAWSARVVLALAVATAVMAPRAALGAWDCGACATFPRDPPPIPYDLSSQSTFEVGCFGPCACPVLTRNGLAGSFVLVPYRSDPLFAEYLLCGIDWTIPGSGSGPPLHVVGEGWYRVGGEVVAQQELNLCVSVNGGKIQRFESGVVPGGGSFPAIDIAAATSGFFCWDSVMTVKAGPASAGLSPDGARATEIRAWPNPSSGTVDFDVFLPQPGVVSVTILDVEGRSIWSLEHGVWLPAGGGLLHWDGTRSDGTRVSAGLYLLRLRVGGATLTRRLIRL
jgi:hypothetical protein